MTFRIIPRSEWGARPPKHRYTIDTPTPELWIHHTAGALDENGNGVWWDDVRSIQDFHMDGRGWSDIAYSFIVGGGQVFEGRGFGVAGGHTEGHNSISHAICVIGNYEFMHPTPEDLRAVADIVREGRRIGAWGDITGDHSAASGASTACAGRHLRAAIPEIRRLAALDSATEDTMPIPPWAAKGVYWARATKLIRDDGDVNTPITTAQLVTILLRFAKLFAPTTQKRLKVDGIDP